MKRKSIFTLLLITISGLTALSQINYKPGFIITNDNDTIYGLVKDQGTLINSKSCLFKRDRKSKPEQFLPFEIQSYAIKGDKFLHSAEILVENEPRKFFLDVLMKGKLSLYYYWNNKGNSYYIQKEGGGLIPLSIEKRKIERSAIEKGYFYYRDSYTSYPAYRDSLSILFSDSRRIQTQIPYISYTKKSLLSATREYTFEKYGAEGIYFVKDFRVAKPQVGIYTGFSFNHISFLTYKESPDVAPSEINLNSDLFRTIPFGVFIDFPIRVISDRLVFQTELTATKTEFLRKYRNAPYFTNIYLEYTQVGVALMLKYEMLQNNFVSPSIGMGKTTSFVAQPLVFIDDFENIAMHNIQKGGWFFELGVDYNISRKFTLFSNFRVHSFTNLIANNSDKRVDYKLILKDFAYPLEYKTNIGSLMIGVKF